MASKFVEFINKSLDPVFKKLGKSNLNKENILGIFFQDNEIEIANIKKKKNTWLVNDYTYQKIAGIGKDQDIYSASTYLADQIKNVLDSIKIKSKDAAITLDYSATKNYNLQIPLMADKELQESVAIGGFWDQFDETPENLDEFETSYQIMSKNEELGVMNVVLFTIEKKLVEAYVNIFRLAGINPVIIDVAPASQMNALLTAVGQEGFETPMAIFHYEQDKNYISIASNKSFAITEININEADQVLLDTIEEIEDVTTEFWDEIFERLATQIKQALIEYETRYEFQPISLMQVVTDRNRTKNLLIGLEKNLTDVIVKLYDPTESMEFSKDAEKFLDALPNKSKMINCLGAGLRKLNAFEVDNPNEKFSFNLLPRAQQLKINRKSSAIARGSYMLSFSIFILAVAHLVPFKLVQIASNNTAINSFKSIIEDIASKDNLIKAYEGKIANIDTENSKLKIFGENKKTVYEMIKSLEEVVPKNIRLTNFKLIGKSSIEISGVSKDAASPSKMIDNFKSLTNLVEEATLSDLSTFTEQDRTQLYAPVSGQSAPDKSLIPNEGISQKFNITLAMKPTDGEVFDDQVRLERLVKKK
jgi:Tfp pilus assembly PilM family ATPase